MADIVPIFERLAGAGRRKGAAQADAADRGEWGHEDSLVVEAVRRRRRSGRRQKLGFDALSGRHFDIVNAGIADPAKVVDASPDAAESTASMLLTAPAALAEPEPNATGSPG